MWWGVAGVRRGEAKCSELGWSRVDWRGVECSVTYSKV